MCSFHSRLPACKSSSWRGLRAWAYSEDRSHGSRSYVARGRRTLAHLNHAEWYSDSEASRLWEEGPSKHPKAVPAPLWGNTLRQQNRMYLQGLQAMLSGCNNRSQASRFKKKKKMVSFRTVQCLLSITIEQNIYWAWYAGEDTNYINSTIVFSTVMLYLDKNWNDGQHFMPPMWKLCKAPEVFKACPVLLSFKAPKAVELFTLLSLRMPHCRDDYTQEGSFYYFF